MSSSSLALLYPKISGKVTFDFRGPWNPVEKSHHQKSYLPGWGYRTVNTHSKATINSSFLKKQKSKIIFTLLNDHKLSLSTNLRPQSMILKAFLDVDQTKERFRSA